jgi:hypothetical protein
LDTGRQATNHITLKACLPILGVRRVESETIMPVVTSNLTTPTTVPTMSNDGAERPTAEKSVYLDVVDALTDRFSILFYVYDFVK